MAEQDPTLAGKKFSELVKKMGNVTAWVSNAVAGMNRDQSVSNLVKNIKRLAREGLEARAGARGYVPGSAGARAAMVGPGLSSLKTYLTQRGEAVRAQFEKHAKLSAMGDRFKAVGGQIVTTHEQASGLAGLTGQGLSSLSGALASTGKSALRASADFETYKAVLTTIMGEDKAKASMAWIDEFTRKTPFKLAGVTQAFMTLKGEGIDPMDGSLQALGDAAAATGKPLNDVAEAFADGVGGDWKGLKKLGITLKKTQGDMMSMTYTDKNGREQTIEAAKKDSEAMQAAILHVLKAKGFGGTLNNLSQTWDGMWSSLQHSLTGFLRMIGDAGAFEALKGKLRSILELIARWKADGTLEAWAKRISDTLVQLFGVIEAKLAGVDWGDVFTKVTTGLSDFVGWVQRAVAWVGGWENAVLILAAVLNANLLVSLIGLAGQFAGLVPLVVRVIAAMSSVLASNPIALAIAGIAVAVSMIYEYWEPLSAFFAGLWETITAATQNVVNGLVAIWQAGMTWISSAWGSVGVAFAGFVGNVRDLFGGLKASIAKAFEDILQLIANIDLYAIGAEWIGGLWDGIKAKWAELASWLTDAFKSLADWIPDVARDKLGITAPSGTLAVPPANENRSAVERVAAPGNKALAAGLMAATLAAAGPVAAAPALPAMENAGRIPGAVLAVPGGTDASAPSALPPVFPSPPDPPLGRQPGPSSGNVVNAPVNVSITVNGMAELDALRRETESAVRFALAEWTSRQQADAEASLFDQWA